MASNIPLLPCDERSQLLDEMRQKSALVRNLADTIDNYIEVTSFISSNSEITVVNNQLKSLTAHSHKLLLTFSGINDELYNFSDDDVFPSSSQQQIQKLETESLKEKMENSIHQISKALNYLQNPIYMEYALTLANNEYTHSMAGKWLRKQWVFISKLISNFFPEHADQLPSPGTGLECPENEVWENLRIPLIQLYNCSISKLQNKSVCDEKVYHTMSSIFIKINEKFESLFNKTIWQDSKWLTAWGSPSA